MNVVVLGLQWGDEGKGKAIDYMAGGFDVVVRFQGGHNAGHTIYHKGQKVIVHLLPSGVFTPGTVSVIAHGVVVNPLQLVKEIQDLEGLGIDVSSLVLSTAAPLILPFHQQLDIVFENSRYLKIGTTKRGIGPAYEDLTGRRAVFVRDLFDRDRFYQKIKPLNDYYNHLIDVYGGERLDIDGFVEEYTAAGESLRPHAENTAYLLNRFRSEGKKILFEGAQGALLDITLGTYPYVTSSHPTIGGVFSGTGLSIKAVDKVVGISKAYATRVGGGPFPSELSDAIGDRLREKGNEFGATTGRARRVGWLDLVALKYAIMVNGVDEIFLTKLDVLDGFETLEVVTRYRSHGRISDTFDPSFDFLDGVETVTRSLPGWQEATGNIRSFDGLPDPARDYIHFIEDYVGVPCRFVSVGSGREQTILR